MKINVGTKTRWRAVEMSRWFDGKVVEEWLSLNAFCSTPAFTRTWSWPIHPHLVHVIWTWQCVEKRCHVKEKRQSDNCMESEHCSWESGFPQRRRRAVWRGYLFFICRWKLKNVGEGPSSITDKRWDSWGYCLAFLPPPSLSHSLSISYLSDLFQSAAIVSLGEGREEEEERSRSFSMPSSPASQSDSIHPTLLWSAELCGALLSCSCIKRSWAEELTGLLPDLSACMWEVWHLIPALLINGVPITLQSH